MNQGGGGGLEKTSDIESKYIETMKHKETGIGGGGNSNMQS